MSSVDIKNLGVSLTIDDSKLEKVIAIPIKVYATETGNGKPIIRVIHQLETGDTVINNFSTKISRHSPIVKLIKAANGFIPDRLDDLEELIVGKEVLVDLKPSEDGEYLNPIKFYPVA